MHAGQKYYPSGATREATGTAPSDKLFTGQQQESADALGLHHYGARVYSTHVGRFLSADPIVGSIENPQSWNRYAYVYNNPLKYVDPTGMCVPGVDNRGPCREDRQAASCDIHCQNLKTLAALLAAGMTLTQIRNYGRCGAFDCELKGALEAIHAHCMSDRPSPMCLGVTHDVATGCLKGDQRCIDAERFPGTQCVRWDPVCLKSAQESDICALPASYCPLTKLAKSQPCKWVFGCDPTQGGVNPFKAAWDWLSSRDPVCLGSLGLAGGVVAVVVLGSGGSGGVALVVSAGASSGYAYVAFESVVTSC